MTKPKRYFLDRDGDYHWYVIPEKHRKAWESWRDLGQYLKESWDVPKWADRIDTPYNVTFIDPKQKVLG